MLQPSDHVFKSLSAHTSMHDIKASTRAREFRYRGEGWVAEWLEHFLSSQRAWVRVLLSPNSMGCYFFAFLLKKKLKKSRGAPPRTPAAPPLLTHVPSAAGRRRAPELAGLRQLE